jgi:DNA-binding transcriptional ArsR family regulator
MYPGAQEVTMDRNWAEDTHEIAERAARGEHAAIEELRQRMGPIEVMLAIEPGLLQLTPQRVTMLQELRRLRTATARDLCRACGLSEGTVPTTLRRLQDKGVVSREDLNWSVTEYGLSVLKREEERCGLTPPQLTS